jgi:hypothetical protein
MFNWPVELSKVKLLKVTLRLDCW